MTTTINYNMMVESFHSLNTIENQKTMEFLGQCLMEERHNTITKKHLPKELTIKLSNPFL